MHLLLAGGSGFVGSHLARRLLASGHHLVIVDNLITGRRANVAALQQRYPEPRLRVLDADVCDLPRIPYRLDAILHLASPASPIDYLRYPIETLEAGSTGTRELLELARRNGARFLLASTSEVYGDPAIHPQPESYWGQVNPIGPRSVYDEAKRFAEAVTAAYGRRYGMTVRIARIFNTYGPAMRLDDGRVIPTLGRQALLGDPVTVFGDGRQTRSYCYVDDLVAGLEALLWSDVEGPVNLGNPEEYTVLDTARVIIDVTRSASRIEFHRLPMDDPKRRCPDIARAQRLLGWSPKVPFHEGLSRTLVDLAQRLDEYVEPAGPNGVLETPGPNGSNGAASPNGSHGSAPAPALGGVPTPLATPLN